MDSRLMIRPYNGTVKFTLDIPHLKCFEEIYSNEESSNTSYMIDNNNNNIFRLR